MMLLSAMRLAPASTAASVVANSRGTVVIAGESATPRTSTAIDSIVGNEVLVNPPTVSTETAETFSDKSVLLFVGG